jgi:hypothetical protein
MRRTRRSGSSARAAATPMERVVFPSPPVALTMPMQRAGRSSFRSWSFAIRCRISSTASVRLLRTASVTESGGFGTTRTPCSVNRGSPSPW